MAHPEDSNNETASVTNPDDQVLEPRPIADAPPPDGDDMGAGAVKGQLSTLSAALTAQRMRVQDMERALVDRIADVDDDRRRGEGMLHRASEAQRSVLEARLRRRGWLGALGLFLLLGLGIVAVLSQQLQLKDLGDRLKAAIVTGQRGNVPEPIADETDAHLGARIDALSQQVERIAADLGRLSGAREQAPALDAAFEARMDKLSQTVAQVSRTLQQEQRQPQSPERPAAAVNALSQRIDTLAATVASVSSGLERLERQTRTEGRRPDKPSTEAVVLARQIEQLEAKQRRLLSELEDLRATPDGEMRTAAGEPPTTPPAAPASADAAPTPGASADTGTSTSTRPNAEGAVTTVGDRPYALQLIGFHKREDLLAFAADAPLPAQVMVRQESLRDRPWFALIHSLHPSFEAASKAADALPAELVVLQPWIRTLSEGSRLEVIEP